jgi:vesicle-fusing ATPase
MAGISDDVENLRVNRGDFMHALEEVHPAFGVSEEELLQVIQNGIIHFDKSVDVSLAFFTPSLLIYKNTGSPQDG